MPAGRNSAPVDVQDETSTAPAGIIFTTDPKDKVEAFLKKREFDLPVYYQIKEAPSKLHTSSLPTTFLIDQNGSILIDEVGASDWNGESMRSTLDKLLID